MSNDVKTNDSGEPDVIYLQLHDPDGPAASAPDAYRTDGVTWCWDLIHANDVKYVRADLANNGPAGGAQDGVYPRALSWTSTSPTERGWYWYRERISISMLHVHPGHGSDAGKWVSNIRPASHTTRDCIVDVSGLAGEWYGPLIAPGED